MTKFAIRLFMVVGLSGLAAQTISTTGCGGGDSASPGGGTTGSAGTTGGGGTTGAAGTTGTTGAAGTTGTTGAAGTTGTTGAAGTTGTTGAAGTTGTAGTTGGGAGTSGIVPPATFAYLFTNAAEGWVLNNYQDTGRKNLAAPDAGSSPTLAHDATVGDPTPGSLRLTASFTDWKQYADAIINVSPAKVLTGKVLRLRVRLVSGAFGGGAQIHAGTGSSYKFAAGTWTPLTPGAATWTELTLDLDAARAADSTMTFDPSMVVQIGVKFDTGGDQATGAFGAPIDAVFQIDSVSDGSLGGTLAPLVNHTFDTTVQSYALSNYDNTSRKNLGGPNSPTTPTLMHDSAVGDPSPGSLVVTASYTDYKQYVDPVVNLSSLDLTGKVISSRVRLDSGSFTGGVQLHAGSGPSYCYAASDWMTLTPGPVWTTLSLYLATVTGSGCTFTASDIRQIGVQFDTGDAPEGGTFSGPVDATFHIDTITAQ
jgi:hypothetical protein